MDQIGQKSVGGLCRNFLKKESQKIYIFIAFVIIYIFFAVTARGFFSYNSLVSLLGASYYIGLLAIGVTFVIITGGIDLSIGTVAICCAKVGGELFKVVRPLVGPDLGIIIAIVAILATGLMFGYINGLIITKLKIAPFIATLGTQLIASGFGGIVSRNVPTHFPQATEGGGWFRFLFKTPTNFPTGLLFLIVISIIAAIILNKTRTGRYIFAIGSNREATRLSGVNTDKYEMSAYVLCSLFAALAGLAYVAIYSTAYPAGGLGFELHGIAGSIVGGTSPSGGTGSIVGTLIGVMIMSAIRIGLLSLGLQAQWQTFITGFVVIGAVLLDVYRRANENKIAIDDPVKSLRLQKKEEISVLKAQMHVAAGNKDTAKAASLKAGIEELTVSFDKKIEEVKRAEDAKKAEMKAALKDGKKAHK